MPSSELERAIPVVLERWRAQLRSNGDSTPRDGARGDAEQAFVTALVRAAIAPDADEAATRALVFAAITYGNTERTRRLEPEMVCDELALLRQALSAVIRGLPSESLSEPAEQLILRCDRGVTAATRALLAAKYGCAGAVAESPAATNAATS